ncbi:hypothetical protein VZT92_014454 [Zoarces viviparus]|uniref:Phosphoenolpyruvate carboxykinase C-terminal P-loop domain-containing protein n=1 Tax=Zoarces viviparus TaxID=48416 RepID=A0AAW1EZ84_ZOAVI
MLETVPVSQSVATPTTPLPERTRRPEPSSGPTSGWIFKRCSREREDEAAKRSIIGWLPEDGAIDTKGLSGNVDMGALFDVPKAFWQRETKELRAYFTQQVGADLPAQVEAELKALEDRVHN